MTPEQLAVRVRWLTRYAIVSTLVLLVLATAAFVRPGQERTRFDVIDVERINVVEPDGRYAMIIANEARLPGPILDGREWEERSGDAGILFFNSKGDETGGLTFGSEENDSTFSSSVHMSFDQYENDQVLILNHSGTPEAMNTGIRIMDRPVAPTILEFLERREAARAGDSTARAEFQGWMRENFSSERGLGNRVVLGSYDRNAILQLSDTRARPRIRAVVDSLDVPRLEFLDADGNVVYRLPEDAPPEDPGG